MEFLLEVAAFALKGFIVFLVFGGVLAIFFGNLLKLKPQKENLEAEDLGERYQDFSDSLRPLLLDSKSLKKEKKANKKKKKQKKKEAPTQKHRVFVIDFDGDIRASQTESLREEVSTLINVATPGQDEVLVKVESGGGMVHGYGLAMAQLLRIKKANLKLTISVDKVAASGGYMMACTGDHLIAAPFAILGSIGVIAQVPNFNRLLKKHDVDYEEVTSGEFKRTVSLFGEITPKGKQKFTEQIEDTHGLFKDFVKSQRPQLDLQQVATGEYWYGEKALEMKLCDELCSSDEFIFGKLKTHQVIQIKITQPKKFTEKLAQGFQTTVQNSLEKMVSQYFPTR